LNFDLEYALITAGADVNAQDKLGCTPMHYAFIDMSNFASTSPIDPIETITGLSSIKNIQIDVPNVFKKTPLHYAAQRSIFLLLLILRVNK
jgi:ankyrin repeat protein